MEKRPIENLENNKEFDSALLEKLARIIEVLSDIDE